MVTTLIVVVVTVIAALTLLIAALIIVAVIATHAIVIIRAVVAISTFCAVLVGHAVGSRLGIEIPCSVVARFLESCPLVVICDGAILPDSRSFRFLFVAVHDSFVCFSSASRREK